ncbi:MBL fold metallo-hydrolase [Mangrovicoccus ximenensis]|uniref:MBL fold metallo-hydrolase n=1 Tax=Mangrovicoccus ximenensis TaxID=1911570 RepID=UPI000D38A724|nr:MBL fold metallo-hydrolase [Mangrovicoccus ximenensis]
MKHASAWRAAALGATVAFAGPALAESDPELSAFHVAAAEAAAGEDLEPALRHCAKIGKSFTPPQPVDGGNPLTGLIGKGAPLPTAVFDNLFYLGTGWVSAWALETSEGIILFDALNNEEEIRDFVEYGLEELGRDPADIRKIVVAHGHGDHYGGAVYLQEKYGAEIILSDIDWTAMETGELQFDNELWGPAPERDVTVNDGDLVTLGDTSVQILVTPGHTDGTISAVLPVRDGDEMHKAVIWGGNGLNFGPVSDRFVAMIESQRRLAGLAGPEGIDVFLSNHPSLDSTFVKIAEMDDDPDGPNPFVIGTEGVSRAMTALRHCVAAQLASFDPAAVPAD